MEKPVEQQNPILPEAPASATVKIKSKGGFEYLFTLRETAGIVLLDKLSALESELIKREYTPLAQGNAFSKPTAPTKPCPVHPGKNLKERVNKITNKPQWSHSQGIYPNFGEWCLGNGYPSELAGANSKAAQEDDGIIVDSF